MKDRTMVSLAVIFLVLTTGFGVNYSLVAANKMLGQPMAPEIGQIYHREAPKAYSKARQYVDYGKNNGRKILSQNYPLVAAKTRLVAGVLKTEMQRKFVRYRQYLQKAVKRLYQWVERKKVGIYSNLSFPT